MITIDDPDLEAALRLIEQETGAPPVVVLRRALARAFEAYAGGPRPRAAPTHGNSTARDAEALGDVRRATAV